MSCSVCGGKGFRVSPVLSHDLIQEWQLTPTEASYIDRQQGQCCTSCGANLRSIVLATSLLSYLNISCTLQEAAAQARFGSDFQLLEINEAGMLSPVLRQFPGYTFGAYPEVDMHALPFPDDSFDLIVHSDTLEHIQNPVHALRECYRALKPGGALCFTVPVIVGRMSRDRTGLPPSFHGSPEDKAADYIVHTEFGADTWTYLMSAGFDDVTLHALEYPAALAWVAKKDGRHTDRSGETHISTLQRISPKAAASDNANPLIAPLQQLEEHMKVTECKVATLGAQLDIAKNRIRGLESSTSWRITAPLRSIKRLMSRR